MLLTQYANAYSANYGIFILETLAALAVIAVAGWALVRFGGPRMLNRKGGRLKVLERRVLEPRRSLYLIEVDGRTLLIGASDKSVDLIQVMDAEGPPTGQKIASSESGR
jgi:flagellar biosynthetic protein FliO